MGANGKRPSSMATKVFQFDIPGQSVKHTPWTFDQLPVPSMRLQFPQPLPLPKPQKRSRPAADVDGEHSCMQKKKRRLRLFLITSRLSPQFSHPASNIVDRGSSKIAVWAKQKALGRNLLRKAAILNRISRRAISAREAAAGRGKVLVEQEREQEELQLAKLEFEQGSVDTYTRPVLLQPSVGPTTLNGAMSHSGRSPSTSPSASRSPSPTLPPLSIQTDVASEYRSPNEAYAMSPPRAQGPRRDYLPLPPSPLGLSNYDAFDIDDDIPDPYSHLDEDDEDEDETISHTDDYDSSFSHHVITKRTDTTQLLNKPSPPTLYSDFDVLEPEQAVFGDYDQVDDGADAIWPSAFVHETVESTIGSTSPDFPALFSTTRSPSKRTDSFITMPEFRPILSNISSSPNFSASSAPTKTSSNSAPSASPNFSSLDDDTPVSPNFQPVVKSPNFMAFDAPYLTKKRSHSDGSNQHADDPRAFVLARRTSDMEQERQRQRRLMFMHFGS